MRDLHSWNLNLGRWYGVQLRVHVLFLLLFVVALFAAARHPDQAALLHYGVFLAVLAGSVVLHEAGHVLAAARLGGRIDEIILWPLGGLSRAGVPGRPLRDLVVALAGPFVNLLLAAAAAATCLVLGGSQAILAALDPIQPLLVGEVTALGVAQMAFFVNFWVLLAVNLLPAPPMDGGAALRAVLHHALGERRARAAGVRVAQLTGLALCVAAWFLPRVEHFEHLWFPVVLLGVFLFFLARMETPRPAAKEGDWPPGYDLSRGDPLAEVVAVEEPPLSYSSATSPANFLEARREERRRRQRQIEEEEDRRVDEVLARLHEQGMEGLSLEDRALLDRAAARYRSRQRQHHE
jgi:Zn-dependent protease